MTTRSGDEFIPLNLIGLSPLELEYAAESLAHGGLGADGPRTKASEKAIARLTEVRDAQLTPSGSAALELAALLAGIGPGDEVVMPSFTFTSTANAFVLRGARPVFVDIRADTLNIDETLIEAAITPRTKAIVPVHYAGIACEMDPIVAIARRHRILVIEDAAQAFLCSYRGRMLGGIGDLGCFSFHATKTFTCGEGGALVTNDSDMATRAEILREKGTNRKAFMRGQADRYTWCDLGSSYMVSDLTAAILLAQIERRDAIVSRRRVLTERYFSAFRPLADAGRIGMVTIPEDCRVNYHLFWILAADEAERSDLIDHLGQRSIGSAFHYQPLHRSPYARNLGIDGVDLPVTERQAARLLRLPLFTDLTLAQQDRVIEAVLDFFHTR